MKIQQLILMSGLVLVFSPTTQATHLIPTTSIKKEASLVRSLALLKQREVSTSQVNKPTIRNSATAALPKQNLYTATLMTEFSTQNPANKIQSFFKELFS